MLNDDLVRTPASRTTRVAVFIALFAASAVIAAAQSGFVTFSGSVADESGRGIPGATVMLANAPRQMKYEVRATDAGRFEFVGLPAGEYALEVRGLGFQVLKDTLKVGSQDLHRSLELRLGSLEETVVVTISDARDQPAPAPVEISMPVVRECAASSTGGRIVPPRRIRDLSPQYPPALRGTGVEGVVVMEGRIGLDGYIGDLGIVGDAHPELAQAVVAAVREWRFTQTLLNCEPVEVALTISTSFRHAPPPPPSPPTRP